MVPRNGWSILLYGQECLFHTTDEIEAKQGFEPQATWRSDMKRLLTAMVVLAVVATPALARPSTNRHAAA
jgi:hypothetical protein